MIYTTGTIAGNGSTITGTGTNFTAAGSLIRVGCTLIAFTTPVQVLQITAITNGTLLSVTPAISPVIAAGTKYAILLSDSLSVDGLAQDIAETFGMYQKYMGGFADVMNSASDVTITINGTPVAVPGQKSLAKKGANSDITSLSGLTTALSIAQGGTGAKNEGDARSKLGLGSSATRDASDFLKNYLANENREVAMQAITDFRNIQSYDNFDNYPKGITGGLTKGSSLPQSGLADDAPVGLINNRGWHDNSGGPSMFQIACTGNMIGFRGNSPAGDSYYYTRFFKLWTEANTTVDSNGFIKRASPVIKIFTDGRAETNDESDGALVIRQDVGRYMITGVLGLNSDAAWGGIDGGFEIPVDRNKQPRLWLDYEMNSDGSILVKTYHRTHPEAPEFARNRIGHSNDDGSFTELVKNGEPVDIPADSFVSVRVDMPADSIWNQKQLASEKVRLEVEFKDADGSEEAQS